MEYQMGVHHKSQKKTAPSRKKGPFFQLTVSPGLNATAQNGDGGKWRECCAAQLSPKV